MTARMATNSGAGSVQTASRAAFVLSGSGRHVRAVPNRQYLLLLTIGRNHLSRDDALLLAKIESALPDLASARLLTDRLKEIVRNVREDELETWVNEAEPSPFGAFTCGLRRDQAAVAAPLLREPRSYGQTEGQISLLRP